MIMQMQRNEDEENKNDNDKTPEVKRFLEQYNRI